MNITFNQREIDTIGRTMEILKKHSELFAVLHKDENGLFCNKAETAYKELKSLMEE